MTKPARDGAAAVYASRAPQVLEGGLQRAFAGAEGDQRHGAEGQRLQAHDGLQQVGRAGQADCARRPEQQQRGGFGRVGGHLRLEHGHQQQGQTADAGQGDHGQAERLGGLEAEGRGDDRERQADKRGGPRLPRDAIDQQQHHHRAQDQHADGLVDGRHRRLTRTSRITAMAMIEPKA
jgi:hypothetical protein